MSARPESSEEVGVRGGRILKRSSRTPGAGRAVAVAAASSILGTLPVFLLGSLAVLIRSDLGFDQTRLGFAVAAFFLSSAAAAVPGGRLTERIGARLGLLIAAGLGGAALLGLALATPSWPVLLGWMVVAGAGNGIAQPAANLPLARGVSADRQGLAFGLKQSAIPVATLVAGAAVPLVGLTVGWRWGFGGAAAAALLVVFLMPRDPYRSSPRAPGQALRDGDSPTAALVVLAVAGACGAAAGTSLGSFFVESAVAAGVGPGTAGSLLAVGSVAGIGTRITMGWRADRRGGDQLPVVSLLLAGGAVGFAGLAAGGALPILVSGTVLAFGAGWGWPGLFNYAVVRLNRNAPAAATGITQTGVFVGGVVGPAGFGAVASSASFAVAWWIVAVLNLLAAACMILGTRMIRREPRSGDVPGAAGGNGPAAVPQWVADR